MDKPSFAIQLNELRPPAELDPLLRTIEEIGYRKVTLPDHLDGQAAPLAGVGYLAARTTRVKAGTLVLNNELRHPGLLGREFATLAGLFPGRIDLGIGAGWKASDLATIGAGLGPARERIDRLAEALEILSAAAVGKRLDFEGRYYRISDLPMPAISAPFEITVGGGGARMLPLAAAYAGTVGINPRLTSENFTEETIAELTLPAHLAKIEVVKSAAAEHGRDPLLQVRTVLVRVGAGARAWLAEIATAFGVDLEEAMMMPPVLAGSVDELVDKVGRLHSEHGIGEWVLHEDQIESFAPVVASF